MTVIFDDFLMIGKPTKDIVDSQRDFSKTESENEL